MEKEEKNYEKYIVSLSEKEIEKIARVSEAVEKRFEAEANKESQLKMRILFERTAKEHLPFIIYCIYMGIVGVVGFVNIDKIPENYLIYYLIALVIVMIAPFFLYKRKISEEETESKKEDEILKNG